MVIKELLLKRINLITLPSSQNKRGFFCQLYSKKAFIEIGILNFVQDNFSRSAPKVLRGLNRKWDRPQGKRVTITRGSMHDVVVDIEKDSSKSCRHFAHRFCVLGHQKADEIYKIDNCWNPNGKAGLKWNDPVFEIQWPYSSPLLSPKDKTIPPFEDYKSASKF